MQTLQLGILLSHVDFLLPAQIIQMIVVRDVFGSVEDGWHTQMSAATLDVDIIYCANMLTLYRRSTPSN